MNHEMQSARSTAIPSASTEVERSIEQVAAELNRKATDIAREGLTQETPLSEMASYARERPFKSMAIAAVVGLLAARIFSGGLKGDPTTPVPPRKRK